MQTLAPAFKWLNSHTVQGSTVFCHTTTAEIIPLYTHNSVLIAKNAIHESLSRKKAKERLITYFALAGYSIDDAAEKIKQWPYRYIYWGLRTFGNTKDLYSFGKRKPIENEELRQALKLLKEKQNNSFENILKDKNVDYLFISFEERKELPRKFQEMNSIKKVFDKHQVQIYELTKPPVI
jgi:hypothetical protein